MSDALANESPDDGECEQVPEFHHSECTAAVTHPVEHPCRLLAETERWPFGRESVD